MNWQIGSLSVALGFPCVAMAQQPRPPLPFQEIPQQLQANPLLECGHFEASNTGEYNQAVEQLVTRANSVPKMGDDYMIVGGKCDFHPYRGRPGVPDPNGLVNIQSSKQTPDGYLCMAAPSGQDAYVTTTATLFACRPVAQPIVAQPIEAIPVDPAPTATKPYGVLGVIARRGKAFQTRLKYDYRVCNVDDPNGIKVGWYDQTTGAAQDGPRQIPVPAGFCMELNAVTYIQIQGNSDDPPRRAYYNRYPRNSFARGVRVVAMPANDPPPPAPGTPPVGARVIDTEPCSKVTNGPHIPEDITFARKCRLPLPKRGDYRICFSDIVVDWADDSSRHDWAPPLLPMIVDAKLIGTAIPEKQQYNAKWNDVIPNTCRDYYDVARVYVLVGEGSGWPAKNMLRVHMTYAPLK